MPRDESRLHRDPSISLRFIQEMKFGRNFRFPDSCGGTFGGWAVVGDVCVGERVPTPGPSVPMTPLGKGGSRGTRRLISRLLWRDIRWLGGGG